MVISWQDFRVSGENYSVEMEGTKRLLVPVVDRFEKSGFPCKSSVMTVTKAIKHFKQNFLTFQDHVSKEHLVKSLHQEFVTVVNEAGVDPNRLLEHPHTVALLQFVCGLGPRKASSLLKVLLENRVVELENLEYSKRIMTARKGGNEWLRNGKRSKCSFCNPFFETIFSF